MKFILEKYAPKGKESIRKVATTTKLGIVQTAQSARLEPGDILTPEQLAKRLQVGVNWVYEKSRSRGKHGNPLPVLRCGRYLRFSWPDVCSWLRSNDSP
jgi:hypothetical protein